MDENTVLTRFIKLTEFIDKTYTNLYEAELKQDWTLFQKSMQFLNLLLKEEEEMYQALDLDQIPYLQEYLIKEYFQDAYCDIEAIIQNKMSDRVYRRIMNQLDFMFENHYAMIEDEKNRQCHLQTYPEKILYVTLSHDSSYEVDIENACLSDYYNSFLCILKKYMKDPCDKLLQLKYDIAFINRDIELDMIDSQFQLKSTYFSRLDWYIYLHDLNIKHYMGTIKSYGLEELEHQIGSLLPLHDKEYEKESTSKKALLRCCFIRASLLFLGDKTFEDVRKSFTNVINSPEYISNHNEDGMTSSLVYACFRKRPLDQKRKTL